MELNIKKLEESAVVPSIEIGSHTIKFNSNSIGTGVGRDGKIIVEYKANLSVEIPEGHVGIVSEIDNAYAFSLTMTPAITVLKPGWNEIIARFKTNTDSVPNVFEKGEPFSKLTIIKYTELESVAITEAPVLESTVEETE